MNDQTNQVGVRPGDAERRQEPGSTALGRGGRMSRQRQSAAVLRLLRGEDLESVSRELGVTAATLTGWRGVFFGAGGAALATRAATGGGPVWGRLCASAPGRRIRSPGGRPPALLPAAAASHEPRHVAGHRQTIRL